MVDVIVADSGTGTESPSVQTTVPVSDSAFLVDASWRIQGQVLLDGQALPHISEVTIRDSTNVRPGEVAHGRSLPARTVVSWSGRLVEIKGQVEPNLSDALKAWADKNTHSLILPTGDSFRVQVVKVNVENKRDEPADPKRYDYLMMIKERVD